MILEIEKYRDQETSKVMNQVNNSANNCGSSWKWLKFRAQTSLSIVILNNDFNAVYVMMIPNFLFPAQTLSLNAGLIYLTA